MGNCSSEKSTQVSPPVIKNEPILEPEKKSVKEQNHPHLFPRTDSGIEQFIKTHKFDTLIMHPQPNIEPKEELIDTYSETDLIRSNSRVTQISSNNNFSFDNKSEPELSIEQSMSLNVNENENEKENENENV